MMDYKNSRRFRDAGRIIALSETIRKDLIDYYKVPARIIEVEYPSVTTSGSRHDLNRNPENIRKRYQLPARYLFISVIAEKGNHLELAIDALPDISPDLSLVITSQRKISHIKTLEKTAARRGVSSRVSILENLHEEDMRDIAAEAEIILCLSHGEGFPFTLLRSITTGRPVIAACGPTNEEIGGPDSFYINASDRTELIQAIHAILSDPAAARMMGEAILSHSRKFHTIIA